MKESVVWLLTLLTSIGMTLSHKVTRTKAVHTTVIAFYSRHLRESLELGTSEQSMFLCLAQCIILDI